MNTLNGRQNQGSDLKLPASPDNYEGFVKIELRIDFIFLTMFQLITADKLVVDTKYMILLRMCYHSGVFKGKIRSFNTTCFVFDEIYDLVCKKSVRSPLYLTSDYRYYEFISDEPQWQMERRAVNLIVRRLIGDDCFTW